jgi:stage II sporulation protein D
MLRSSLLQALLFFSVSPLLAAESLPSTHLDDTIVRVRVFDLERPGTITLKAEAGPIDFYGDGRLLLTLPAGRTASVELSGARVRVRVASTVEDAGILMARPRPGAVMRLTAGRTSRAYRGDLEVAPEGTALRLINVISLEDYVPSVVPVEYPFQEIEGVKAQTILVRTYAVKSRGRFGTHDLVDHVQSQVYRGLESETRLAREVASQTRGEILTYQGQPIEAVYSSSSGGHTADNDAVWQGRPLAYLRGRPDPYDRIAPHHRWNQSVDRGQLLRALSQAYGFNVSDFSVAGTSREGRVTSVRLHGSRELVEQGNAFRLKVNAAMGREVLRSTFFTVQRQGAQYVFSGGGWGHGVGMSQFGARQQAIQGHTYQEILAFYFQGAVLDRWGYGGAPMAVTANPPASRVERPAERGPVATTERPESTTTPRPRRTEPTRTANQPQRVGW